MELTAVEPRRPRRRFWLQFILFLSFLTCLILGLSSLAALVMLRNRRAPVVDTVALPAVVSERIASHLALNLLAGDPADALALQAATAGETETAWAILAFDTTTTEQNKAVLYSLLSRQLIEANSSTPANVAQIQEIQRLIRTAVVLSPDMETTVRGQVLSQGVADLLESGGSAGASDDAISDALLSATDLQRMAERLPDLLPVQRRQLLEPLDQHVDLFASPDFEQRLSELLRNPFLTPTGTPLPLQLTGLIVPPSASEPLLAATAARETAARQLAQSGANGGSNQSQVDGLAEALRLEESIRRQTFDPLLADATISPGERLGILFAIRGWAALKAQIAVGGFGLSIVPEWGENTATIEAELTSTTQAIDKAVDQLMETLADPKAKAALRVEKFLWLALQSERGLFPGSALQPLSNDLRFAQDELATQGVELALPVFWDTGLAEPSFHFQPAE